MNEIKLEKRYPHSRTEDITDAFIRGYEQGRTHCTSVLAELHERFDALENELRRASAEMSAIIREYVDRPKGEWIDEHGNRIPMTEHSAYCSHCGEWSEYLTDYCGNCSADMRGDNHE